MASALGLVKELLSNVDQDVHELEKEARLQEIYNRMDPRAQTPVPGKGPFGRDELLRRKLIHEGCLLWKTATGRFKGQWCSQWTSELDILCELQSPLGTIFTAFGLARGRVRGKTHCCRGANSGQNPNKNASWRPRVRIEHREGLRGWRRATGLQGCVGVGGRGCQSALSQAHLSEFICS